MRVDGALQENVLTETNIANALLLRLKLMSGLDISEKRLPQDGRFNIKVRDHSIDVRVSTMPVQYGESCVMRLLDQSAGLLNLEQTGMPEDILARVRRLVHRPYGMFVVTGPTGSGKTTTLYGALSELNQAEKNHHRRRPGGISPAANFTSASKRQDWLKLFERAANHLTARP